MSLLDTLKDWIQKDAKKYIAHRIPYDHVENQKYKDYVLRSGKDYLRLVLAEMYLKDGRKWLSTWYPVVHALVRFQFGSKTLEIPRVAGTSQIADLEKQDLSQRVALNYPLTASMPLNNEDVEIEAGLLGMRGSDYLKSLLKVLGDFSKLLAVPQLSTALALIEPLASGVQDLLSGGNGYLELGFHQLFSNRGGDSELRPGYIAVLLATEQEIDKNWLWVREDRLHLGPSLAESQLFTGVTHMLLRLEGFSERDDWATLESISVPFEKAKKILADKGFQESDEFVTQFRAAQAAAITSPDLTAADQFRVAKAIKVALDELKALRAKPGAESDLNDAVQRYAYNIPLEEALRGRAAIFKDLLR
jgi:hypothetical protein